MTTSITVDVLSINQLLECLMSFSPRMAANPAYYVVQKQVHCDLTMAFNKIAYASTIPGKKFHAVRFVSTAAELRQAVPWSKDCLPAPPDRCSIYVAYLSSRLETHWWRIIRPPRINYSRLRVRRCPFFFPLVDLDVLE